jgi:hypothetical protein
MEDTTIDTSGETSLLAGADPTPASNEAPAQPSTDAATTEPLTHAPPATGWVNPDGTFGDKWLDALPEDVADYKTSVKNFKSVPDLVKALGNANALIGKKLGVPSEQSTPEEVAAFRKAMGVPESLEEYKFAPDALPEGMTWSDEMAKPYAEIAYKHSIPPSAMKELVAQHAKTEMFKLEAIQATYEKQRTEAVQALQKEWGGEFTKNIGLAKQAAKLAGVDANSHGFSDPEVVRGFVRMAAMMSEDKVGRSMGSADFMTGSARAKDIMSNPDNAWHKRYMEGDREAAALVTSLLKQG